MNNYQTCISKITNPMDVSVAVVGAGASGLAAAMTLFMTGIHNVTVLEASDRIGGRIKRFASLTSV